MKQKEYTIAIVITSLALALLALVFAIIVLK